jgi:zinc protease
VSSDVPATDLVAVIERSFARLPRHHTSLPTYVAATPQAAKKIAVPIAGKASIDYMIGVASGITKDHADYPPLLLGMQVLGAPGLVSRLTQAVREEEGLTYDVRAVLDGFNGADGSCIISATFAPTLYEQGKASIMRQVRKILDENISAAEVRKYAQMYEARTRVFSSNSGSIARTAHQVTIEGRSPSYLDEFPKKILKLTPREVHAALKKYLVIDDLSESAAGPVAKQ